MGCGSSAAVPVVTIVPAAQPRLDDRTPSQEGADADVLPAQSATLPAALTASVAETSENAGVESVGPRSVGESCNNDPTPSPAHADPVFSPSVPRRPERVSKSENGDDSQAESSPFVKSTTLELLSPPAVRTDQPLTGSLRYKRTGMTPTCGAVHLDGTRSLSTAGVQADTEARKREIYRRAFSKYDTSGDGHIDTTELMSLLDDLGWEPSDEEVKQAIASLDKDGNGEIELEEFLNWSTFSWKNFAMKGKKMADMGVRVSRFGKDKASPAKIPREVSTSLLSVQETD